jgi:hypothetical protein
LQELLFWHDDFLFCKVDGLHYEINSYHDPLGKHTHACLFKNGLEAVLLPTLILLQMSIILKVNIITKSKSNTLLQKFKVGRRKKSKSVLNL